jgi:hypothetical protein
MIILWKHIVFQHIYKQPNDWIGNSKSSLPSYFLFHYDFIMKLSPINIDHLSMLPIYGVHVKFHFTKKYVTYIKNKPKFCYIPKWAKS